MDATSIDLSPLFEQLIQLLAAVLLGVGLWAARRLLRWLETNAYTAQIVRDRQLEQVMEKAVRGAVGYAEEWAYQLGKDRARVDVRNEMAREAVRYVLHSVPAAVTHFGLTRERVAQLVYSRLPTPNGAAPEPANDPTSRSEADLPAFLAAGDRHEREREALSAARSRVPSNQIGGNPCTDLSCL